MQRIRFSILFLVCFSAPILLSAQVSQPYCIWEDGYSDYHLARIDPASGNITTINNIPGMSGIVAPNTSVFKPTTGEFICLGFFTNQIALLRMAVSSGGILAMDPVSENWVGLRYHCKNDTIYAIREINNNYDLVWIDPINAAANSIAALPMVNGHVGYSFSLDADNDSYTFQALSGASLIVLSLDIHTGSVLNNNPFSSSVPGQFFNCNDGKIYGLVENQQNSTYHLGEVLPAVGTILPIHLLPGITPGFITEGATFGAAHNQFTYRGFDTQNNATIFAIDVATGAITASAQTSERLSGIEDSLCCQCLLPNVDFNAQLATPQVQFTNLTVGSPHTIVWDFGDGDTSQATSPLHTYQQFGTFQVCLTATNNCGTDSACQTIVVPNPQNNSSAAFEALKISPQPANTMLSIELSGSQAQPASFRLQSASGKLVVKGLLDGQVELETAGLSPGMYFLTVFREDMSVTRSVLVAH